MTSKWDPGSLDARRRMRATELRVHLGEALRTLADGEIVIEKDGFPVAVLSQYRLDRPARREDQMNARNTEYARTVGRPAAPNSRARLESVLGSGWAGINAGELVANIYRWRAEGPSRFYSLDDDNDDDAAGEEDDDSGLPPRQRRLHPGNPKASRVADGDGPRYRA